MVAVQNAIVQETHGDRLVSVRFCLGRITLRGSPLPIAPGHHPLTHVSTTSIGRSSSLTPVEDLTKRRMLLSGSPCTCVMADSR